jgi:maltooligosyltrehalose trehalohydrolase
VHYLQNHDQIANSGFGRRIHQHAKPADLRAMTALLLLAPQTPMLFQGQEFAASAPFLFFADHAPDLAARVEIGRIEFLSQFPNLQSPLSLAYLEKAESEKTFARCKLDHEERERHADIYLLHHDLLKLRRDDPVFADPLNVDGAVLSESAFLLRFFANPPHQDRLLLVNLAADVWCESVAEPLLAPPAAGSWQLAWSSEHPKYGGEGIREIDLGCSFALPRSSAQVFAAVVPSAQE